MRRSSFRRTTPSILVGQALAGGAAQAATFEVTNTNDAGAGSLRDAVLDANATAGADTVVINAALAGSTITLTSGEISISEDITITGPVAGDPAGITISGNSTSRIFNNALCGSGTAPLTLENLTLTAGQSSQVAVVAYDRMQLFVLRTAR